MVDWTLDIHQLFWQLSRDGNLRGSGMSHATTVSPKPCFRAPWRVGDAVVGRENAGLTISKNGHPCSCQNCPQRPPAEKTGRGSLLNRPSYPPNDIIGQGTELNELHCIISFCIVLRILYQYQLDDFVKYTWSWGWIHFNNPLSQVPGYHVVLTTAPVT